MNSWSNESSASETWTETVGGQHGAHGFQFDAFQADAFQTSQIYDAQSDDEMWTDL